MAAKLFSGISELNTGQLRVTEKILGSGSYASVYEVYHSGMKCAGKKLHNIFFQYSDERTQQSDAKHAIVRFAEECRVLSQLGSHPNIVEYKGIYWENGAPAPLLVMECLPVDIDSLMQKCGKLPHEISYHLLHSVASGLKFLHDRETPIVHRDLTARNVLVSTNLHAKIADFGMSTGHIRLSKMTQTPGNFVYMPPESMCANPSYDTSIDIFSFGILAIYMLSGTLPVPNVSAVQSDASGRSLKAEHEYSRRWEYLDTIGFNHPLMNLIFLCIDNNPRNRSTAASVLAQMNDMVTDHPVPPMYMEKWKVIIERLKRNEDVRELVALEQQIEGHAQVTTEEHESDSCCLGIACISSGGQEGTYYPQDNEQIMNIKESGTTSGCSLSGATNLERELKQVLLNKVVSLSLSQVISSDFKYHYAHLTIITGKTNTLNLATPLFLTTNCYSNMDSPIVPSQSLKSEMYQGPKGTSGYHQLVAMDMHTCTPGLTVILDSRQVLGWPELSSLAQFVIDTSHSVSEQIMLLLAIGAAEQHKGAELCIMLDVSRVSLIISTLQALLHYIDSLLGRMQESEDPQACALQLSALATHPNTFSSNFAAIIKTAVASIQHINREPDAVLCEAKEVSLWSMKGQLLCYQFSPTLAMQMSNSVMGTPVAKLETTVVSVPVVCPSATIDKLGRMKIHRCGCVAKNHEPTPLKATSSFLQTSVYYYINSNHLYTSFQTILHLSNRLSSLNVVYCSDLRFNIVDVQSLIGKQSMDKAITTNAKINTNDHMSQLTAENVNQHVIDVENSHLAFSMKLGSHISPSAHAYGKPDKITGLGSTHKSTKVAVLDSLKVKRGSQTPPKTNTTNHEGHMLTSPPLKSLKLFQGHSLKHLMVSCRLTSSTACTAADMKTIPIIILENLALNGLELQELAQFLVDAVKGIQESRMLLQNGQAMSGRALLSQLTMDQTQDAMRNITVNINNVLSSKPTHTFGFIASDKVAFKFSFPMHFFNQIMQKPLTTTHLLPLAQKVADKVWERMLSPCIRMYTCNDTSLSLQLCVYAATEGMQTSLTSATKNPFIVRCSIDSDYLAEFGNPSKTTARISKPTRKSHKPRNVELSTNGERKKPKNVTLRQNISHFEQGTRVHTDIIRLGNLSSIKIHPWLVIKLRLVDATVYLFLDAYDYRPSNLYYDQPQDVFYPLQQEAIVTAGNKQRSINFHNTFKNSSMREIQILVIETTLTTSKQTSLANASTHLKLQGSMLNGSRVPLWDIGHYSHHVIGTIVVSSHHTSEVSHREHSVAYAAHVLWQWPNKYGNRRSHNSPIPAVVIYSLAKCEQSTLKILCCTQAVSNLLNCGLMMLSAEVRQALSTIRSISPLKCTCLVLDLSAYTNGEAVHYWPITDKDRVLSYSPQNLPETELNVGDMSCHGKPKSDKFLLPLIEAKIKPLSLQEPPMNAYILIIKHLSAAQERNLDSMTIKESTVLKSLHHLTIRPHQHTAPSNSPPLYTSNNSDHKGTSGGTNDNRSNKESAGRESGSGGGEDHDCGERGDKGGEDSCDKSGGGDGSNHRDGGGSDGEGKKLNRKDKKNHRPQSKKKRKKGRERKRRCSTKQSSTSPTEKMKKKKPSHMHKKICHGSLENFTDSVIAIPFGKLTEESEAIMLKPSQFPTTVIKPHPQKSPSKSLPLYGRYMYSKRNHRRLGDSVHTHNYNNNADIDSNGIGKYGDEKDHSDKKEEKLSSKVRKRRHPRHKRRRKRRGRREKGKKRHSTNSKRRLRKKKKSRNYYRLNRRLGLQHVQQERSYDQPSETVFVIPRASRRSQGPSHIQQCIVHGKLLICGAREWHFSSNFNGGISRATTSLVPPARPSFNLSFIPDSIPSAVAERQCLTPRLHCGAMEENLDDPMVSAMYSDLEDYQSDPYFPPPVMEQDNNIIMIHHRYQEVYPWQGEGICLQEVNPLATLNANAELVIQGQRRRPHLAFQRNDSNSLHTRTWGTVSNHEEATSGFPNNAELVIIGCRRRSRLMLPNRPPFQATIAGRASHIHDHRPAIPISSSHQISSGAAFMTNRASSLLQCSSIQQLVVPAYSILSLQNVQNLSFEWCQVLLRTRAWDVQGRWLHYRPIVSCRTDDISKTSPTCSAIAHGRLLIRSAQERHFSSNFNGGISRATTSLVPPARPSFNHSFIPDSIPSACILIAEKQCLTSRLHCGAMKDDPMVNAMYDDLEDYQSAPYFPPPIMEQNVMIQNQELYQAWQGEGICLQEVNLLAAHNANAELVIQGRRRRPHLAFQRNHSNSLHTCTWGTVSYHEEATSGLPNNAELVTIGRRRRPQLMLPNRPPYQVTIAGSASHVHIHDRQPALPIPSSHQISSFVHLNDPYRSFISLTEHTDALTTEQIVSANATHCDDAEVHTATVRGPGSTTATNVNVGPLAPMELCNS